MGKQAPSMEGASATEGGRRMRGKQPPNPIRKLYEDLNQPGLAKFKEALRARNVRFSNQEVAAIVQGSAQRQIFAPRPRCTGGIVSTGANKRWAADIVDLTATPSSGGQRVIFVVQDIYTRKIHAVALTTKVANATATAFRIVLGEAGVPEHLTTDRGSEFNSGAFPRLLDEKGIVHQVKDPRDVNAIATLDRAIQTLKKALMKTGSTNSWHERLTRVVAAQNALPHDALFGAAPKDVKTSNEVLDFALTKKAALDLQHNDDVVRAREKKLTDAGAYREQLPWSTFERSFKQRYSGEVHEVARIERGDAVSTIGKRHQAKLVQPVPRGSAGIVMERSSRRGSVVVEERKRRSLEPYARRVAMHIGVGNESSVSDVGKFLQRIGGFVAASRDAGLNQKQRVAGFLRTFPERFNVTTSAGGGTATVRVLF